MDIAFGNNVILTAYNTTRAQTCDLVQSILFALRLRAHRLALRCKLPRRLVCLLEHLTRVQPLHLPVHSQSHLRRKQSLFDDVDVLERIVLVEDNRALDAVERLDCLTNVL